MGHEISVNLVADKYPLIDRQFPPQMALHPFHAISQHLVEKQDIGTLR
jgi:hypothetical protein